MKVPNELECCITLAQKDILWDKHSTFWAYSQVTKIIKFCEYDTGIVFKTLHFLHNLRMGPMS
jgi:hypothetical protein